MRDHEEPHQPEYMIEPHRTGVAHRRAQHPAKWLEAARGKTMRIIGGQPPILAGGVELVGRRAHRQAAQHQALLHPGVGAGGIDADRCVEIEPDRQPQSPCDIAAGLKLPLGVPLQKFVKFDFAEMAFAQLAQNLIRRLLPRRGPIRP